MNLVAECRASKQGGNALLLLLLIKEWDGAEPPTREELAGLIGVTVRQAERLLVGLINDGEIEKSAARGRGVKTTYRPVNRTSVSDKDRTEMSDQTSTHAHANTAQTDSPPVLSDTNVRLSKSDINVISDIDVISTGDKSDENVRSTRGTKVAPYLPKTDQEKKGAKAPRDERGEAEVNSEGLTLHAYIGHLLKFRTEDLGVRELPAKGGEAKAAKWLYREGYTTDEVKDCYRFLKSQAWRSEAVHLMKVQSQIAAWKKGELGDGVNGKRLEAGAGGNSTEARNGRLSRGERIEQALAGRDFSLLGTVRQTR